MTNRLYYDDSYLTQFEAVVTACIETHNGYEISLDQSAFYPTSGGQPHDRGSISRSIVVDVFCDDLGEIWHRIDQPLSVGTKVHGEIDWQRRFDHMQQHGGEHILAGSLWDLFRGFTHGLHIGNELSTIDVTMPDGRTRLEAEECLELEKLANSRIQQAVPMRAWFPTQQELNTLPLRKDPTTHKNIRIVAAGDFEMVACGGTHPDNTGEIGLIKILGTAPVRGKLRLSFLCGERALRNYQTLMQSANMISTALSVPMQEIAQGVSSLLDQQAQLREEIKHLRQEQVHLKAKSLLDKAITLNDGTKLVKAQLSQETELKDIASLLISEKRVIALLGSLQKEKGLRLLFARSKELDEDMPALMRDCGAKGGGRADFAQGSSKDVNILQMAKSYLLNHRH